MKPLVLTIGKKLFECLNAFIESVDLIAFGDGKSPRQEENMRRVTSERVSHRSLEGSNNDFIVIKSLTVPLFSIIQGFKTFDHIE